MGHGRRRALEVRKSGTGTLGRERNFLTFTFWRVATILGNAAVDDFSLCSVDEPCGACGGWDGAEGVAAVFGFRRTSHTFAKFVRAGWVSVFFADASERAERDAHGGAVEIQ